MRTQRSVRTTSVDAPDSSDVFAQYAYRSRTTTTTTTTTTSPAHSRLFPRHHLRSSVPADTPAWYGLSDELLHVVFDHVFAAVEAVEAVEPKSHAERRASLRRRLALLPTLARFSKDTRRACKRALSTALRLSEDQTAAFEAAMCRRSVFISGGAGVGKSETLRRIVEFLPPDAFAVTASTGCAAALVNGTTLHSFAGVGLGTKPWDVCAKIVRERVPYVHSRVRAIQTLVIDEVSMLDGELLETAANVVGALRSGRGASTTPQPWGRGLQVIFVGDFLQLPPVSTRAHTTTWAFDAPAWRALAPEVHLLTTIHRQDLDRTFAETLARIRVGKATPADVAYLCDQSARAPVDGALCIFAHNEPTERLNAERFESLVTEHRAKRLRSSALDRPGPMIIEAAPGAVARLLHSCPAPEILDLCIGARVVCLRNIGARLVNGSLGTVVALEDAWLCRAGDDEPTLRVDAITVRFDGVGGEGPFDRRFLGYHDACEEGREYAHARSADYRHYRFTVCHKADEVSAERIQIPLKLAWAVSIHKSQGMSLERATIDFDGVFAAGQAYTALSRVRTLANAHLVGLQLRHLRLVDRRALAWYAKVSAKALAP